MRACRRLNRHYHLQFKLKLQRMSVCRRYLFLKSCRAIGRLFRLRVCFEFRLIPVGRFLRSYFPATSPTHGRVGSTVETAGKWQPFFPLRHPQAKVAGPPTGPGRRKIPGRRVGNQVQLDSDEAGMFYPIGFEDPDGSGDAYSFILRICRNDEDAWVSDIDGSAINDDYELI